jgi:hypothetical protein
MYVSVEQPCPDQIHFRTLRKYLGQSCPAHVIVWRGIIELPRCSEAQLPVLRRARDKETLEHDTGPWLPVVASAGLALPDGPTGHFLRFIPGEVETIVGEGAAAGRLRWKVRPGVGWGRCERSLSVPRKCTSKGKNDQNNSGYSTRETMH